MIDQNNAPMEMELVSVPHFDEYGNIIGMVEVERPIEMEIPKQSFSSLALLLLGFGCFFFVIRNIQKKVKEITEEA